MCVCVCAAVFLFLALISIKWASASITLTLSWWSCLHKPLDCVSNAHKLMKTIWDFSTSVLSSTTGNKKKKKNTVYQITPPASPLLPPPVDCVFLQPCSAGVNMTSGSGGLHHFLNGFWSRSLKIFRPRSESLCLWVWCERVRSPLAHKRMFTCFPEIPFDWNVLQDFHMRPIIFPH